MRLLALQGKQEEGCSLTFIVIVILEDRRYISSCHEDKLFAENLIMSSRNTKLFISGLSSGVQQKDVFDLFSRHGKVLGCSVKNNYAFVVRTPAFTFTINTDN